jgi:CheY-like chemotaxis protein
MPDEHVSCPHCDGETLEGASRCRYCGSVFRDLPESSPFRLADLIVEDIPDLEDIVVSGRYEIQKEIGRGGMGVVFLARDRELDTRVAVKFLPAALARSEEALDALRTEAKLAMSLSHPNIVRLHTLETSGSSKFLVMEYVDGPCLWDVLDEKGSIPLQQVLEYASNACAALDYAHSEGVVHRDIKPGNFLLDSKGLLKLADFGIAQRIRKAVSRAESKIIIGTPMYMSPEHIMGREVDHRSDIYSLGTVIYEMLTGLPPFISGDIEAKVILDDPRPILHIPEYSNSAIMKALQKNPDDRWQSAAAFYEGLAHGVPETPAPAAPPLAWPQRVAPATPPPGGPYRVLAADDEEDIRELVALMLAGRGYEVDTARDGIDALDKAAGKDYNLIVLDIMMPGMNGIQALVRLRNAGRDTPVLMLTALSDQKHVLESYRSGADYYMVKPFTKKKLIAAARYLLGDFTDAERPDIEKML